MAALPGSAIFTDGNANAQRLGFAIGGALLWGSAALFAPAQPKPQTSQYEGGTQQAAATLQATGGIWPGRFIPTALPPPRRMAILAGPQFDPSQTAAAIFKQQPPNTVVATPVPFKRIAASPQSTEQGVAQNFAQPVLWAPVQLFPSGQQFNLWQSGAESQSTASVVFKSFVPPTVARLISQIVVGPQDGSQGSGQLFTQQPPTALAPPLKGVVSAAPQADPAQIAAQVFHQQLQTQQVQTPNPFGLVWTAWQSDPSQIAPQIFKAQPAAAIAQPFGTLVVPPQSDPTQIAAQRFQAPPASASYPAFGLLMVGQREERYEGVNAIFAPSFAASVVPVPDVPVAGGGYGREKKKHRYIVKHGDQLLVFTDKLSAVAVLTAQASPPKKPKPLPKAAETVSLPAIKEMAQSRGQTEQFTTDLDQKRYEALIALFEQMRDEEEIELLLLHDH